MFHWILKQFKTARPLNIDHIGVCITVLLLGWLLFFFSEKIGIFDPLKIALDDFYTTDIYYEMIHSDSPDIDSDIVIVDMTDLSTRDEIAQAITDIKQCNPKVLCVDLIFERPSFDALDDVSLIASLQLEGPAQILSCKLRDYDNDACAFKNNLFSFFRPIGINNIHWAYSNYRQIRMGGCTRETSVSQQLNDSTVFSFPYTAACIYKGKPLQSQAINERQIIYEDVDFITIKSNNVLQEAEKIKGKIVILGTLHEEADMHFTPLGKMAGVKVVAYSIHTYLKEGGIKDLGTTNSLLIAMIAWWIAAIMGFWIEKRHPIVFAIVAKLFNFALGAFLIWVSFEVYTRYYYNIDLLYPLLGLAMVEDIREMYSGIIKWLQEKTKWKIFNKSIYKQ